MATSMDPPATSDAAVSAAEPPVSKVPSAAAEGASKPSMGSPPLPSENPKNSSLSQPSAALSAEKSELQTVSTSPEKQLAPLSDGESRSRQSQNLAVPYTIPEWSKAPSQHFFLEVLKDGSIIDQLDVTKKGAYMFGRIDLCDFVLEHPTISRFHAVLQFKGSGQAYLYDLGSTHGTFMNKNQVNKKVYVELHVGDVIRFGLSSRLYIFQGPTELMAPEADLKSIYYAKDREASLHRAREEAALADGVSWGMREDAVEEAEDDADEITWQNYKGELTEKQQKTREKVLKRMEKIAHMKKEISAIRAKDIAQGGLTQGQQTQIARNEMRISQIMEELESLEETLNDSIRESIGARAGKSSHGRQRGVTEDEDDLLSDDDEFYDRTKKRGVNKSAETQAVETADSLLDKKEAVMKEMEEKRRLLAEEKDKMSQSVAEQDAGDELDAFMSGLSSQLVLDRTVHLEKDLSSLQTELDRIVYLLKLADPTGEAARKRETAAREQKLKELVSSGSVRLLRPPKDELKEVSQSKMAVSSSTTKQGTPDVSEEANVEQKPSVDTTNSTESKPAVYQVVKPQWLGAVEDRERKESHQQRELNTDEADEFVDYRDRKKILDSTESQPESALEKAAPGLILRKKKQVEKTEISEDHKPSMHEPAAVDMMAEDAVALLLKHKRGLYASDEEAFPESHERDQRESGQDNKRPRRVLGPEKPAFLETYADYETWVPPEGQSGDGRTSLNDRLGY